MDPGAKAGGGTGSVTPSTAALNQRIAARPGPRMLDEVEIELLRQSAKEMAARMESSQKQTA